MDISENFISAKINISENLTSGSQYSDRYLSGVEALGTIKVKSLAMRECGLGPKAISVMASPSLLSKVVARMDTSRNKIGIERHERNLADCKAHRCGPQDPRDKGALLLFDSLK